jgi:hypothetical protein
MKNNKPFKIQFICIMALFLIILVQGLIHVIPFKLNGFAKTTEPVPFTFNNFLQGDYQHYLSKKADENCGFREVFIRSYNQFLYSGFHEITNTNLVEGKDKELFLKMYTDDVMGKRLKMFYPSIDSAKVSAEKNVASTLEMIDSLKQRGINFLFVFAPTKPSVYPEYLPQEIRDSISWFSLEEYYIELFEKSGIEMIDFYSYFKKLKKDAEYPLYSRYGTHWAESTIPFVADSILRKLESFANLKLPSVEIIDENVTRRYSSQDNELERSMNLLCPLRKPALPKPIFCLRDTAHADKPNLLVVADSYFIQLQQSDFIDCFNNWDYWKYNRDIFSSNPKYNWQNVKDFSHKEEVIANADVIMAIFTSPTLYNFMYGFPKTVQDALAEQSDLEKERIEKIIRGIRENPKWLEAVKENAEKRGVSVDEMILREAKHVIKKDKQLN